MTQDLSEAVALLQSGELVAFPTETVYGLGADAANPQAVAKIFAAKGRPADHPLIVHLPGAAHLESWAKAIPVMAWELAEAFWPGPLTLILKRASAVPYAVTGGQETVGVRVPSHPVALDLLRAYAQAGGGQEGLCGIAAPSANRFGRISPTDAAHVYQELGAAVALVLDGGPCQIGIESSIIDLSRGQDFPPRLLRPGPITPEQIEIVIGQRPEQIGTPLGVNAPRVSGSLDGHYAPQTPLCLVATSELSLFLDQLSASATPFGVLSYSTNLMRASSLASASLRLPDNPRGYAQGLYAVLRELDRLGNALIVVEAVPENANWAAVADRLHRAAYGSKN